MIVLTQDHTAEDLKEMLVQNGDGKFYTRESRSGGDYKVLFYRLPGRRRSCKVDILTPGTMNIPNISWRKIVRIERVPVLPFIVLLILKVQGWSDHVASHRRDFNEKQFMDVRDINEMLGIGRRRGESFGKKPWIPSGFMSHGIALIDDYVEANGGGERWELLDLQFDW